jgi:hypothetical protein
MIDAVAARERQELARRIAHVSRQHLVHQHVGCLYADPVCTENLSSGVVVVKSAKDGV